jgi:hypothetical protein
MIERVLHECDGDRRLAVERLGIGRTTLWAKAFSMPFAAAERSLDSDCATRYDLCQCIGATPNSFLNQRVNEVCVE